MSQGANAKREREKFEESKLALLYQDETAGGKKSNFNKLISR